MPDNKFGIDDVDDYDQEADEDYREKNLLARSYLGTQRERVGNVLRLQKMEESALIDAGLYERVIKKVKDEKSGKTITSKKVRMIDIPKIEKDILYIKYHVKNEGDFERLESDIQGYPGFEKFKQQHPEAEKIVKTIMVEDEAQRKIIEEKIGNVKEQIHEHKAYQILYKHMKALLRLEKDLLKDSKVLFEKSALWDWCLNTSGLADVAAMTYMGFIPPYVIKQLPSGETRRVRTKVSDIWAYAGLLPDIRLKHGEQGKFNPLIKARFRLVATNVIRANDKYYKAIFDIKKEYLKNRPDLLALLEEKPRGWKAHIDSMAVRVLNKLLISHALSCIIGREAVVRTDPWAHRNPIPLKPTDPTGYDEVLIRYRNSHARMLAKLKTIWIECSESFRKEKDRIETDLASEIKRIEASDLEQKKKEGNIRSLTLQAEGMIESAKTMAYAKYYRVLRTWRDTDE